MKKIKTKNVLNVFNILDNAKYTKMKDEDKIKVWKAVRALKPIATEFDESSKDAINKFKPNADFDINLQKAQEYEKAKSENKESEMTEEEYNQFIVEYRNYNKLVDDAIKDFAEKEVELDFETLSEEAFAKLMASNDWTVNQTIQIGDILC